MLEGVLQLAVKTLGNITVSYNSNALAGYLSQASLESIVAELDVTNLASSAAEKIPGLGNWSIPVSGFWAPALDAILAPDSISPPTTLRTLVVVIGVSGSTVTFTFTSAAFISNYRISADSPSAPITWSGTLSVSGNPVRS